MISNVWSRCFSEWDLKAEQLVLYPREKGSWWQSGGTRSTMANSRFLLQRMEAGLAGFWWDPECGLSCSLVVQKVA